MKALKQLAADIIDKKIRGNQDQIVINFIWDKYKDKPEEFIDRKIESAMKNFNEYKRRILKARQVKEYYANLGETK